jgi:hypothetical protein
MDSNSLNILVEARKEYLDQLNLILCPHLIESFEKMYGESVTASKGKKILIQFQTFLKEVPNWNDNMIKKHADSICSSCSWFNDLLAAVFVSSVKILSSVRLNSEKNKISLKLPTNQVFIHGCFINISRDLYKNPYVYHEPENENDRDVELINRFSKVIEVTVKEMIPIQEILKSCISQENPGEKIEFNNETVDDDDDPEFEDSDGELEPQEAEAEAEAEADESPQDELEAPTESVALPGAVPTPVPTPVPVAAPPPPVREVRNIDIIRKPGAQRPPSLPRKPVEEDDGILFSDARE